MFAIMYCHPITIRSDIEMSDYPPLPISENLLTSDHRTLDAKSVTFEIWKNRMNKDFVSKFVEILR